MKKKYLILSVFAIVFTACETDLDVNATWEEVTIVYGLLDAGDGKEVQQIKISKAFLGNMDALQMAQYADSINFGEGELDVKVIRIKSNGNTDTITLLEVPTVRNEGDFNDSIRVYTFENEDDFLKTNYAVYELLIKNTITGNTVSSKTRIISGFDFDNVFNSFCVYCNESFVNKGATIHSKKDFDNSSATSSSTVLLNATIPPK